VQVLHLINLSQVLTLLSVCSLPVYSNPALSHTTSSPERGDTSIPPPIMADNPEQKPAPAAEGGGEGEAGPSKKALKKLEAKAKKEAEKAKRVAELEAQRAAAASKEAADDKAKDNYGDRDVVKLGGEKVALKNYGDEHLGKTVKLRAWIQQSRMQGASTKGVDPNSPGLKEYVDFFRQAGCPPHGGGGIGLDRVVAFFLNLPNVQLAAYYPRTPNRLTP
jgi:hypothetical protein